MSSELYWCERFVGLTDAENLRQKVTTHGAVSEDFPSLPLEDATRELRQALRTVFYPTNQCLNILHRLIGISSAHCLSTYPDARTFMKGLYAEAAPLTDFSPPLCLTGLAGIGKTEVLRAFRRLLSIESEVTVDDNHPPFRIHPPWLVTVQSRSSSRDVLGALANQDGKPYELTKKCRRLAYRDGIPFLIADELQFVTGSDSANTRVSQMLMSLGYIGIPFLFAANFSMLSRLMKRPGEEQQRLLAQPIVMLPDPPDSEDWRNTITALTAVEPHLFKFDVANLAQELHHYTFGRKRALSELLTLAFRIAYSAKEVTANTLAKAYKSSEYTIYRNEVECLNKQLVDHRPDKKRLDLWCPIPIDRANHAASISQFSIAAREREIADAEVRSSLTPAEAKAAAAVSKAAMAKNSGGKAKVLSIQRKKEISAETLKSNMDSFLDRL
ncbi:ATP-binding protein [uncultured Herbaspirillum sp.]|uniref:ATP-binding protein n=1 Tax=uncultured Herbaspirillum sp. TaxID=160236 RepID=UPI0025877AD7|nr:ATP-binding protein [uncultured Herbaspirillum sp.]